MRFGKYAVEAELAVRAVREAARLCRAVEREPVGLEAQAKRDQSPVTIADLASQAVVTHRLGGEFPQDALVAEEDSASLRLAEQRERLARVTSHVRASIPEASEQSVCDWIDRGGGEPRGRFWVLDPLDGTKGYLRRAQYVVALALIEQGRVMLGVLGCPHLARSGDEGEGGMVAVAVRGQGAWAADLDRGPFRRMRVSARKDPKRARVLTSVAEEHTDPLRLEQILRRLDVRAAPRRMDSQAKFALMAAGHGDLFLRLLPPANPGRVEKIWDFAAGSILLEEAGGRVTDLRGEPLDFRAGLTLTGNLGVLASNGLLHSPALQAIRAAGADRPPGEPRS